jgi:tetratricopeptide (TPR) repeat protein
LWEIFHDLQYNAFVWSYNKGRVERGLSRSRIERFLFRKDWRRIAIYSGSIFAYGCIGFLSQDTLNVYLNETVYGNVFRQVGNVFACSALIHFYLDGFIWKMRDAKVREDLGMGTDGAQDPPAKTAISAGARHWLFVAALFAVSITLATSEHAYGGRKQQAGMSSNLVSLVPNSSYAHFLRATEFKQLGFYDSARSHYLHAIALDTNYGFSHALVADLDLRLGDTAMAILSYEKALALDPMDPLVNANLADLYLSSGRMGNAETAFKALMRLEPNNAQAYYGLAFSLLQQRRGLDAKPYLERSLELDSTQPAALNYLGMVEHALGNPEKARALYEAALRLVPDYEHALQNLKALDDRPR